MLYDYNCSKCDHTQEESHHMDDHPEVKCEKCNTLMSKVIGAGQATIVPFHMKAVNHDRSRW